MGNKCGGRKAHGGGKSRQNKDHRRDSCRINKHRWDDQCAEALLPDKVEAHVAAKTELDPDKPGLGQFYCVACSRYYINLTALQEHSSTAKHRRRLKMLKTEKPYSHAEAMAGAGKGTTDHGLNRRPAEAMVDV